MYTDGGSANFASVGSYPAIFRTNGAERMRIDSSGRVGIGTSSMSSYEQSFNNFVIEEQGNAGITIATPPSGSTNFLGQIAFAKGTTGDNAYRGLIRYSHIDDAFSLFTAGLNERLRITSTGAIAVSGASNYGTSGQVLTSTGNSAPTWQNSGGSLFTSYAIISDQKSQNTEGGTFTKGAWRTRDLNTEIADPDGIVSIASNQFTLSAGTYLIEASAPAYRVSDHMVKLYNATSSSDVAFGTSGYAQDTNGRVHDTSIVKCRVTITGSTAFEIQHRSENNHSSNGFGHATNFGPETYTVVEIYKE